MKIDNTAEAAQDRHVIVPAGQIAIVVWPTEWSEIDTACEARIGVYNGPNLNTMEKAAAKVREAGTCQLKPRGTSGRSRR